MRSQMITDVNAVRSYQAGTNELLNKLKQQMDSKLTQA